MAHYNRVLLAYLLTYFTHHIHILHAFSLLIYFLFTLYIPCHACGWCVYAGQLTVAVACPAQWSSYSMYCYYVSKSGVTVDWATAHSDCLAMNAELVSISDAAENSFVFGIS